MVELSSLMATACFCHLPRQTTEKYPELRRKSIKVEYQRNEAHLILSSCDTSSDVIVHYFKVSPKSGNRFSSHVRYSRISPG